MAEHRTHRSQGPSDRSPHSSDRSPRHNRTTPPFLQPSEWTHHLQCLGGAPICGPGATLLRSVFALDVLTCHRCSGKRRLVALLDRHVQVESAVTFAWSAQAHGHPDNSRSPGSTYKTVHRGARSCAALRGFVAPRRHRRTLIRLAGLNQRSTPFPNTLSTDGCAHGVPFSSPNWETLVIFPYICDQLRSVAHFTNAHRTVHGDAAAAGCANDRHETHFFVTPSEHSSQQLDGDSYILSIFLLDIDEQRRLTAKDRQVPH